MVMSHLAELLMFTGNEFNPASNAPVPTFPRTVPRTVSLQRTSDRAAAPSGENQNRMSQFVDLVLPPPPPMPAGHGMNGDVVGASRTVNSHDTTADER
jgi:hypothetical protein